MTRDEHDQSLFIQGRNLWYEYQHYDDSLRIKREVIARMARHLDLTQVYIRKAIDFYLWD